jgi:hypothetical protein
MSNTSDVPVWFGGRWSGRFDDVPDAPQVLGYVRVAADDESRGRDSQIAALKVECSKHGFELVGVVRETESLEDDDFLAQGGSGPAFALDLAEEGFADAGLRRDGAPPMPTELRAPTAP